MPQGTFVLNQPTDSQTGQPVRNEADDAKNEEPLVPPPLVKNVNTLKRPSASPYLEKTK